MFLVGLKTFMKHSVKRSRSRGSDPRKEMMQELDRCCSRSFFKEAEKNFLCLELFLPDIQAQYILCDSYLYLSQVPFNHEHLRQPKKRVVELPKSKIVTKIERS